MDVRFDVGRQLPAQVSSAALWYNYTRCALKLVEDLRITGSTSDAVSVERKAVRVDLHKVDEEIAVVFHI
jgi:hypothetical protein